MENTQFQGLETATGLLEIAEAWSPVERRRNWGGERSPFPFVHPHGKRISVTAPACNADSGTLPRLQTTIQVQRRTQLILRCEIKQRSLALLLNGASLPGLKVLACCALYDCQGTTWLLVVDDDQLGRETLAAARLPHRTESVLLVEVAPRSGAATRLSRHLAAAKIDVVYSYAAPAVDDRLTAVFKTTDDEYAMRVLQAA